MKLLSWNAPCACHPANVMEQAVGQPSCPCVRVVLDGSFTAVAVSVDLLLVCSLTNVTCAITIIMTTLIFIIVSRSHAFFLVVVAHSSLHVLVAVAVNCYFQHTPAVQSNDIHLS